jgi:hypothetical protein
MTDTPPATPPAVDTPPATPPSWYSTVADADDRGLAELKGWDSPDKAIKSYRDLEKFVGAPKDELYRIPKDADDAALAPVRERLGLKVPDDIAEYKLPVPEGMGDEFAKQAAGWFKDSGIPPAMAGKMAEKWNGWMAEQMAQQDAAVERGITDAQAALKAEWGGRHQESMALAQRAEAALKADLGVDDLELKALQEAAPRAYYKLLAAHGSVMKEAAYVEGQGAGVGGLRQMSPDAAKVELANKKADPVWAKKVLDGDPTANAEHNHLLRMVYGDK